MTIEGREDGNFLPGQFGQLQRELTFGGRAATARIDTRHNGFFPQRSQALTQPTPSRENEGFFIPAQL